LGNKLLIAVFIPLILLVAVAILTLFHCKSEKKNYFLLTMFATMFVLIGHILELASSNADEAFTAIRVLYIGSGFVAPFILFFIADYCDVHIHRVLKVTIMLLAIGFVAVAWTTNTTGLLYENYWYDIENTHYLFYNSGKLNVAFRLYPALFSLFPMGLLAYKLKTNRGRYRTSLWILLFAILLPYLTECLYTLFTLQGNYTSRIYFTPYVLAASILLLYIGIMKYDMFDATPVAALMAMETISDAFLLLDRDLGCLSSNSAAKRLFPRLTGLPKGELVHTMPGWPPELRPAVFTPGEHQIRFEREEDGAVRHFRANINCAAQSQGGFKQNHWSVLIQDITENANFMKQLEEEAYTDTLTGLYNRRHFGEMAAPSVERARRLGTPYYIMISDLDFFKRVNDQYGHLAGDAVLCSTARILKNTIRAYDILARWGGEEFIMLFTDSDPENVMSLTERIRQNIENAEVLYMNQRIHITLSSGIAQNEDDCDLTELVRRADEALYASKQNGRNRVTLWAMDS
jgi:diguanylate cyclase (GGDEF)-like protein